MQVEFNVTIPPHFRQAALRAVEGPAESALMAVALDGEAFTKRSFGRSPSAPWTPPGVVIGNLRAGIHVADGNNRFHKRLMSSADYGLYLEYGTMRMAPRPFMRPALWHMSQNGPTIFRETFRLGGGALIQ